MQTIEQMRADKKEILKLLKSLRKDIVTGKVIYCGFDLEIDMEDVPCSGVISRGPSGIKQLTITYIDWDDKFEQM